MMTTDPRVRHRARPKPQAAPDPPSPTDRPSRHPSEQTSDGYAVGYGKPPKSTRFGPGRSGNPKGRPKGAKNLKTLIERELGRTVVIRDEGGRRSVAKREVVAKQLVKKALEGQDKAILTLLKISDEFEAVLKAAAAAQAATPSREPMDGTDREILAEFEEHILDSVFDDLGPLGKDRVGEAPEDKETDDET